MHGLEHRVVYPTLVEHVTEAGGRIMAILREHDEAALWPWYEELEADLGFVRERAAFSLGWQHGSADGRAEFFRSRAPALSTKAKRLADQARALVVNGGLTPVEAAALLVETTWAVLLERPAPPFEGETRPGSRACSAAPTSARRLARRRRGEHLRAGRCAAGAMSKGTTPSRVPSSA